MGPLPKVHSFCMGLTPDSYSITSLCVSVWVMVGVETVAPQHRTLPPGFVWAYACMHIACSLVARTGG